MAERPILSANYRMPVTAGARKHTRKASAETRTSQFELNSSKKITEHGEKHGRKD